MIGSWDPTPVVCHGYDDAVTMSPGNRVTVELEDTSVSSLVRLRNIAHGIPLNLRNLLITVQAVRMGG